MKFTTSSIAITASLEFPKATSTGTAKAEYSSTICITYAQNLAKKVSGKIMNHMGFAYSNSSSSLFLREPSVIIFIAISPNVVITLLAPLSFLYSSFQRKRICLIYCFSLKVRKASLFVLKSESSASLIPEE